MDAYIAVDIGGTQLRAATYLAGETRPHLQKRIATQGRDQSPVERLIQLIHEVWPADAQVRAIAAAAPGPTDPYAGVIITAPNIAGWDNLPLRDILQTEFNVPVGVGNDANLAAMGEWKFGAGKGHHHVLYLTISTGIGGGIILDDRLVLGQSGLAGELGHITVEHNGPMCGCGHRGHLEAFASGTAIANYVAEQIALGVPSSLAENPQPSSRDIAQAAESGDTLAQAAFSRAGTYLGRALANFLHIFNPSIVVFGGGVSQAGPLLFTPMRAALAEMVLAPAYTQRLTITTAANGDNAGLLGALALAIEIAEK